MKRQDSLEWFLIKKFIEILLLVGITEYFITFALNKWVFPPLLEYFFSSRGSNINISSTEAIFFVFAMLVVLLSNAFTAMLPSPVRETAQGVAEQVQQCLAAVLPSMNKSTPIYPLEGPKALLLFLVFLVIALSILLPYILGAICFARITIHEFRVIQQEWEAQQKEFDRKRNLMLSDIAHDLRTPMTTVSGYANALADGMVQDPQKQAAYLSAIQRKSHRMNDLINLLFEYVKLDSEGFSLDRKPHDLCEIARENAALIYSDVEDAGMTLDVEIPDEPIMVSVDEVQISRVVTNLLTNAMRHNDKGIHIMLCLFRQEGVIHLMVADSGSVIPKDFEEHLFEPFARGDASRKSSGGSGLGLSIAKKVVEMHGWRMKLVQQPQIQHYPFVAKYAKAFLIQIKE
jgi:signal transduction histidine kinase